MPKAQRLTSGNYFVYFERCLDAGHSLRDVAVSATRRWPNEVGSIAHGIKLAADARILKVMKINDD